MAKYMIIDFMNLAHRAKNVNQNYDIDMQVGMAMHTIFTSIRYVSKRFDVDHVVACMEGDSWRRGVYPQYKKNRILKSLTKTEREKEDDKIFMAAMNDLCGFFMEKTNVTCLQNPKAEGDDMIAMFIQCHPDDEHIVGSTDTDFIQLLSDNVKLYDGVRHCLTTVDGCFDDDGKPFLNNKGEPKVVGDPSYELFKKCIRGDKSDNVFSSYPGVREAGTKNKVGIIQAYADMKDKGYDWNNFMMQKWTDIDGEEVTVKEKYELNRSIVDLTLQPEDIRQSCMVSIAEALAKEPVRQVGMNFNRFCEEWDLKKLSQFPTDYAKILNKRYILNG